MNIRLAKAISTYLKLEHSLTSADCIKVMNELEELTQFFEMAEIAIEEEKEYQKRLALQEKEKSQLHIVKPKEKLEEELGEYDL